METVLLEFEVAFLTYGRYQTESGLLHPDVAPLHTFEAGICHTFRGWKEAGCMLLSGIPQILVTGQI